jgi:hypothetical protein
MVRLVLCCPRQPQHTRTCTHGGGGGDRRSPDRPHVTVLCAYVAQHPDELDLVEGGTVTVVPLANTAETDDAWSTVRNQRGKQGLVPTFYLTSTAIGPPDPR